MMMQLSFFADENIQEAFIYWMQEKGFTLSGIRIEKLFALDDNAIIQKALKEKKIILTQDSDFGKIIYTQHVKFYCIIYLRPGHFEANFHIPTLERIIANADKIKEGCIIVGYRKKDEIKIRIRYVNFDS